MTLTSSWRTPAASVHETLGRWMLADGMPVVYDPEASHDAFLVDAGSGREYLDLFAFFASLPLGHGHPGLRDPTFRDQLMQAALVKPTNSDIYTQAMADFVETFSRTLPEGFKHLFFIEGGTLAVENALKVAFDWKVRKNLDAGRGEDLGSRVLHFKNAFHGRSGYTLSLTNTASPAKTQYFPKFDWPRVSTPGIEWPRTPEADQRTAALEAASLAEIHDAIGKYPHDIACIIVETIQGEGGDTHLRPEFMRELRRICDTEEILLVFDEVQSGLGITGNWWAFEGLGVAPDIFSFGKKTQVCGIAATDRVNEVDSCFKVSSRINSTWGGNLVDMVRCARYISIIESENLLQNARDVGRYLVDSLIDLAGRKAAVTAPRGSGLMCAFDLPSETERDAVRARLRDAGVLMLPSGKRSLRFRTILDFTRQHVDLAMERIEGALEG